MKTQVRIPDETIYRLSLYHCYVGEILRRGDAKSRITSAQLADELGIKQETVRRDISFMGGAGRPGAGYVVSELFEKLKCFLGLCDEYPVIRVGTADMLRALEFVFPEEPFGLNAVAYYSELPSDADTVVSGVEVRHINEIPRLDRALDAHVALVACSRPALERVLELLGEVGVGGVLLLTPAVQYKKPEGMVVRHMRMQCDIKSLACRYHLAEQARLEEGPAEVLATLAPGDTTG